MKITPISQFDAMQWMERFQIMFKLEKSRNDARVAYDKAENELRLIRQYFLGDEQMILEGDKL